MKKFLIMFLLVLFFMPVNLFAPKINTLTIIVNKPVDIYSKLMKAILQVESKGDSLAYNPIEQAYGAFQIRPIRLNDYNKRAGKNYTMRDCYRMDVSIEVFLYYARLIGSDYEIIAKSWNGSGPMTIDYWRKVKQYL